MTSNDQNPAACPLPLTEYPHVLMAHGGGGKLMSQLIERLFMPAFSNPLLAQQHDGAVFQVDGTRLAFTTDSYVVDPLFFPGGDIGTLAVNGTVNDLAMCGARPLYLSAGFIIEEGLDMATLQRVAGSMQMAARQAQVQLVTGDTKVVDRGKGDKLFINTAGIGRVEDDVQVGPEQIGSGDAILISGDVGRHGLTIMAQRESLAFETTIESDCASVAAPVLDLVRSGVTVHCLRDLTRGGLASALVELAVQSAKEMIVEECRIAVVDEVRGACEILGLDPLYVANEGCFVAFVPQSDVDLALSVLRHHPVSHTAERIGTVGSGERSQVILRSAIGGQRVVDRLSGEQLPRIC